MKRKIILLCITTLLAYATFAQNPAPNKGQFPTKKKLYLGEDFTLHFTSPEPIQYVDISSNNLVGDLPLENVFRVKIKEGLGKKETSIEPELGVVTIIGQKFIAQYVLQFTDSQQGVPTLLEITPSDMRPLDIGDVGLTQNELKEYSLQLYKFKPGIKGLGNSQYGISGYVDNIYTLDDYIFLDITFYNKTNLRFDIDQVRFKVEDKKITKATNVQSIEIKPLFTLFDKESFKNRYRNIYVLEKFSFPNNKVLSIELTEKQLSGRNLMLQVDYKKLLKADTL